MLNGIYNLYESVYNVNLDATISDIMNYIDTNTDAYNEGSYDDQSIIDYYSANGYSYSEEDNKLYPTTDLNDTVGALIDDIHEDENITNDELRQLQELDTSHEQEGIYAIQHGNDYDMFYAEYNDDGTWTVHDLEVSTAEAYEIIEEAEAEDYEVNVIDDQNVKDYEWEDSYH